jgi:cytoskeletal protein RodZ
MDKNSHTISRKASELAGAFGSLIRSRRQGLSMSQDQLALATGVGRRFLIDLEAGKTSCQLGRSLVVAEALGLRPADILDILKAGMPSPAGAVPDLPDLPEEEEPNG